MTEQKYETLTLGQALDAVSNGDAVEFALNPIGRDGWDILLQNTPFAPNESKNWQFRRAIPKKKKLVPFTQETWPIGAWVKYNETPVFVAFVSNGYAFLAYIGYVSYSQLLRDAKLLVIENGRVVGEKPCGMEVEE